MSKLPRHHRCHRHIWSTSRYDSVVEGITVGLPAHLAQLRLFYRSTAANIFSSCQAYGLKPPSDKIPQQTFGKIPPRVEQPSPPGITAPTYKPAWGDGRYRTYQVWEPARKIDSQSSTEGVADNMEATVIPLQSVARPTDLRARHGHHDLACIQPLVIVHLVRVRCIRPATTKVVEKHDPVALLCKSFSKIG